MRDWIKRSLEELSTQLVLLVVIALLVAIAGATWAAILSWDGPAVMLLVVGLIAGILIAFDRALYLFNRLQPPITKRRDLAALLQKWALEVGNAIRTVPPNPSTIFEFVIGVGGVDDVGVAQHTSDPEFITVGVNLFVAPGDQTALDGITGSSDSTLIEDLLMEMARLGVGYAGLGPHPLRVILLEDKLLLDESLNKLFFLQRVLLIRRARALLQILIGRAVRQAQQSTPDTAALTPPQAS